MPRGDLPWLVLYRTAMVKKIEINKIALINKEDTFLVM
jgi:hypothetical protein